MSSIHQELRRLPSLKALAAFAAAGETGNFSRAAELLCVTQGAVSRHIRTLESELGVALFERHGRRVALSAEGQRLLAQVGSAFQLLASATDELRRRAAPHVLTISVLPSLAAKWLSPRLARFYAAVPEAEVRVNATRQLVDLVSDQVDVAIRYGRGHWPGVEARRLMGETLFPVCSPALLQRRPELATLAGLARAPLLHSDIVDGWAQWFEAAGVRAGGRVRGSRFNEELALLQAAQDGLGVALGRSALVARDLAAGTLVAPLAAPRLRASFSYWLVMPERRTPSAIAARFAQWVTEEAASDAGAEPGPAA